MSEDLKAFIVMPFDPQFNSIYEDLIKPSLEDAGYDVRRADSLIDQQNILRDIVRGIATADLIVADLTTLNPNVLYELGLAHGLRISTILLAQSIQEVPFDLRSYRIQVYSYRYDQAKKLKQDLRKIAEKHIRGEVTFGSPITDFLPEFEPRKEITAIEKSKHKTVEKVSEEAEEEKGFLDYIVEGNKAGEEIARIMTVITEDTQNIGKKWEDHTAHIQTLGRFPRPGTAAQLHKIALTASKEMIDYSGNIENNLPILDKNIEIQTESFSGYLSRIDLKSKGVREQVLESRNTISKLLETIRDGLKSTTGFRDVVSGLRGISRDMNRSSRRLVDALNGLISFMEKEEAFCQKALLLIDERLGNNPESEVV